MTTATANATVAPIEHPTERLQRGLVTRVEGALWAYDPIRQSHSRIQVSETEPGRIVLSGVVPTMAIWELAGRIAQGVKGVTSVDNQLTSDTQIESSVAVAIGTDPEIGLESDQLRVSSFLGTVYIGGTLTAGDIASARRAIEKAEQVARGVPGVVEVINQLVPAAAPTPQAAAATGGADDSAPGSDEEARAERLAVWRERAAQRGKG
jgi:osmotically-inducible protein OsmY